MARNSRCAEGLALRARQLDDGPRRLIAEGMVRRRTRHGHSEQRWISLSKIAPRKKLRQVGEGAFGR